MGDNGKDTGDRFSGLRLEQARRILVLECAVMKASKPAKVIILVVRRKSRKLAECTTEVKINIEPGISGLRRNFGKIELSTES